MDRKVGGDRGRGRHTDRHRHSPKFGVVATVKVKPAGKNPKL